MHLNNALNSDVIDFIYQTNLIVQHSELKYYRTQPYLKLSSSY